LSAEENWLAAERALRQKPWRPWVIHFSGEKERSGWDWADLLLKVSVPVLILFLSTAYSFISAEREEKISRDQTESLAIANYIKEMQPLLIGNGLRLSSPGSEVRVVARGLTLAALSQVNDSQRKRLIIRFLLDTGLNDEPQPAGLIDISEANLRKADLGGLDLSGTILYKTDLSGADLRRSAFVIANLQKADLRGADLSDALFHRSDLSGADLRGASLRRASFKGIVWDEKTKWPGRSSFQSAKRIPESLKQQLGL